MLDRGLLYRVSAHTDWGELLSGVSIIVLQACDLIPVDHQLSHFVWRDIGCRSEMGGRQEHATPYDRRGIPGEMGL